MIDSFRPILVPLRAISRRIHSTSAVVSVGVMRRRPGGGGRVAAECEHRQRDKRLG